MEIHEKLEKSFEYFHQEDIPQAKKILLEVETELHEVAPSLYHYQNQANLGSLMINVGEFTHDRELITCGITNIENLINQETEDENSVRLYYHLANGYSALHNLESKENIKRGKIDENYSNAKKYYRRSLDLAKKTKQPIDPKLLATININFGNCLSSIGREIEAIPFYDQALKLDGSLGMALGNKAISLHHLSSFAHGHTHLFLLEAHRLFEDALKKPIPQSARRTFQKRYDDINSIIQRHQRMLSEEHLNSEPTSPFHQFLRDFCVKHQLYLTPTTFIGKESALVYGDPMFISRMVESLDNKGTVDQYFTFLNQIKLDFIQARYFLIQSQYHSTVVDTINLDVIFIDTLDYSIHNAYSQFLKLSLKSTIDTFDKIAQFLCEYCAVEDKTPKNIQFRNIWTQNQSQNLIRPKFALKENPQLLALFDLSLDLRKDSYYQDFYELRNAITHRFLIVHEMGTPNEHTDLTTRISKDDLLNSSIIALQLLRVAVMYLIQFVDREEKKKHDPNKKYGQLPLIQISPDYQWRPSHGEDN